MRGARREFLIGAGRTTLGLSLLGVAACSRLDHAPVDRGTDEFTSLIDDLQQQIPALLTQSAVPGLSIVLISDATNRWSQGFGVKDAASREPVNNDNVFEVGSVSKTVFAYVVVKLAEKGILDLDTPLTKYTSVGFCRAIRGWTSLPPVAC